MFDRMTRFAEALATRLSRWVGGGGGPPAEKGASRRAFLWTVTKAIGAFAALAGLPALAEAVVVARTCPVGAHPDTKTIKSAPKQRR